MLYLATLGGRERRVELEALDETRYRVSIDGGEPFEVDARVVEGTDLSLLAGARSHEARLEEDGDTLTIALGDETFRIDVVDERRARLRASKGGQAVAGPAVVTSPMPGKIVKVLAPVGTAVAEGQGVIVVEAMKMENELRAPKAGTVTEVFVTEGQTVEGKTKLVAIE